MTTQDRFSGNQWECPNCKSTLLSRQDECPKCGVIVKKLFRKDIRSGLDDEELISKYALTENEIDEWKRSLPPAELAAHQDLLKKRAATEPQVSDAVENYAWNHYDETHEPQSGQPIIISPATKKRTLRRVTIGMAVLVVLGFLAKEKYEDLTDLYDRFVSNKTDPSTSERTPTTRTTNIDTLRKWNPLVREIVPEVERIAKDYHKTHTYRLEDLFVCVDMAIDLWNQLVSRGIKAYLRAGSIKTDLKRYDKSSWEYFGRTDHAWVMFQTETGEYMPLEATGGVVVSKKHDHFDRYLEGVNFENPRGLKAYVDIRSRISETCRQAREMTQGYKNVFGTTPKTEGTLREWGKVDQKRKDCLMLIEKVRASSRWEP